MARTEIEYDPVAKCPCQGEACDPAAPPCRD